ncbi:hypothetical protein RIF29_31339 [Crotalaria pallida]|uniref:Uncharacterized protein n=1 Tax=Crotalaria pallida TaxID=3830 RepID=A0AAN9EHS1_CROPI
MWVWGVYALTPINIRTPPLHPLSLTLDKTKTPSLLNLYPINPTATHHSYPTSPTTNSQNHTTLCPSLLATLPDPTSPDQRGGSRLSLLLCIAIAL